MNGDYPTSRRTKLVLVLVLGLAALGSPASAVAAPGDAVIDPDSPSGSEYNAPVDQARDEAGGSGGGRGGGGGREGGGTSSGSGRASPLSGRRTDLAAGGASSAGSDASGLFGMGIRPDAARDQAEGKATADKAAADGEPGFGPVGGGGEAARPAATAAAGTTGTDSALTSIGALTAAVLAGGALLAFVIRRVSRNRTA